MILLGDSILFSFFLIRAASQPRRAQYALGRLFYPGVWLHRTSAHIRLPSYYYELRKTRRRTAQRSWTASRQHFVLPFSSQLPRHFYTRVIAFLGLPHPTSTRGVFGKLRFPSFITYVRQAAAPVIERLVRTIVTPWSGIT